MGVMSIPPHYVQISDHNRFHAHLAAAAASQSQGAAVDVPDSPDHFVNHKMFMTPDGMAGYAVSPDHELVGVFKHKASDYQDVAVHAANHAILVGGAKWLSAFDDPKHKLTGAYSQGRFKTSSRMRFNPEYQPENWNRTDNPDVVMMAKDMNKKNTSYAPGKGTYTEDYEGAVKKAKKDASRAESRKRSESRKRRGQ